MKLTTHSLHWLRSNATSIAVSLICTTALLSADPLPTVDDVFEWHDLTRPQVRGVSLSANGRRVAVSRGKEHILREVESGKELTRFQTDVVASTPRLNREGDRWILWTGNAIIDSEKPKALIKFGDSVQVSNLYISPNGQFAAVATRAAPKKAGQRITSAFRLRVLDLDSGQEKSSLELGARSIPLVSFSEASDFLVVRQGRTAILASTKTARHRELPEFSNLRGAARIASGPKLWGFTHDRLASGNTIDGKLQQFGKFSIPPSANPTAVRVSQDQRFVTGLSGTRLLIARTGNEGSAPAGRTRANWFDLEAGSVAAINLYERNIRYRPFPNLHRPQDMAWERGSESLLFANLTSVLRLRPRRSQRGGKLELEVEELQHLRQRQPRGRVLAWIDAHSVLIENTYSIHRVDLRTLESSAVWKRPHISESCFFSELTSDLFWLWSKGSGRGIGHTLSGESPSREIQIRGRHMADPIWSDDGSTVIATLYVPPDKATLDRGAAPYRKHEPLDFVVVDTKTGDKRSQWRDRKRTMILSADGARVAIHGWNSSTRQPFVEIKDTSDARTVWKEPIQNLRRLIWVDRNSVLYEDSTDIGAGGHRWVRRTVDGSQQERSLALHAKSGLSSSSGGWSYLRFSSNGKRAIGSRRDPRPNRPDREAMPRSDFFMVDFDKQDIRTFAVGHKIRGLHLASDNSTVYLEAGKGLTGRCDWETLFRQAQTWASPKEGSK